MTKPVISNGKPAYLSKVAKEPTPEAAPDKLEQLTAKATELREAFEAKTILEEQLTDTNKLIERIKFNELPELMDQCKTASWTLAAEGNHPAFKLDRKPFYYANIKADSPEAPEAFAWLDKHHPGLVRTTYTIHYGKGEEKAAAKLEALLTKNKIVFEVKRSVPWNTLTAFLREQVEKFKTVPPLNLLGAKLGTVVEMKPVASKQVNTRQSGKTF